MSSKTNTQLDSRFREYSRYTEIKQLAYNIASLQQENMFHSLAVLSFFHGEGRTLLCAALALAYAEACRSKVLIVDTALLRSAGSLAINECIPASEPRVKFITLADRKKSLEGSILTSSEPITDEKNLDVASATSAKRLAMDSDLSIIMSANENPEQYGLVLLDTMPLNARNKNNIDPQLVARLANASILVVSQKLLDASNLDEHLKIVENPALHLIGMISNEEFLR